MGGAKGWDSVLATGRASLPIAAGKWEERGGEGEDWRLGTHADLAL